MDPLPVKTTQTDTENAYYKFKNPFYGSSTEQSEPEYNKLTSVSPPPPPLARDGLYSPLGEGPVSGERHYSPLRGPPGGTVDDGEDYSHLERATIGSPRQPYDRIVQGGEVTQESNPTETYDDLDRPRPHAAPPGRKRHHYQNIDSPPPPPIGPGSEGRWEAERAPPGRKRHHYQNLDSPPPPPIGPGSEGRWEEGEAEGGHEYDYAETADNRSKMEEVEAAMNVSPGDKVEHYDVIEDKSHPGSSETQVQRGYYEDPILSRPAHHNYAVLESPALTPLTHDYDYADGMGPQKGAGQAEEPPHDYDYAEPRAKSPDKPPSTSEKVGGSAPRASWPYELENQDHYEFGPNHTRL